MGHRPWPDASSTTRSSGDTENGKLSSRYDFTSRIAIRGTISTGFRAPTPAEEHFSALNVNATGTSGDLAVSSAAAKLLGVLPLKPKCSTNASGGIVLQPIRNLSITADIYQINIRDRVIGGGNYNNAQLPVGIMPADVSTYYFSNGASTRTQDVDINVNYFSDFQEYSTISRTAGVDLNRSRIHHVSRDTSGNPLLSTQDYRLPHHRLAAQQDPARCVLEDRQMGHQSTPDALRPDHQRPDLPGTPLPRRCSSPTRRSPSSRTRRAG